MHRHRNATLRCSLQENFWLVAETGAEGSCEMPGWHCTKLGHAEIDLSAAHLHFCSTICDIALSSLRLSRAAHFGREVHLILALSCTVFATDVSVLHLGLRLHTIM